LPILRQQLFRDADVADRRVEPDIEDLAFIALMRDRDTPIEVSGDGAGLEPLLEPRIRGRERVLGPGSGQGLVGDPGLQLRLEFRQVEEEVLGLLDDRRGAV